MLNISESIEDSFINTFHCEAIYECIVMPFLYPSFCHLASFVFLVVCDFFCFFLNPYSFIHFFLYIFLSSFVPSLFNVGYSSQHLQLWLALIYFLNVGVGGGAATSAIILPLQFFPTLVTFLGPLKIFQKRSTPDHYTLVNI